MTSSSEWIPITLSASVFQVMRTAMQAKLRDHLTPTGAGFVRYLYALPVDGVLLGIALFIWGPGFPQPSWYFILLCMVAGLTQIVGTILLITTFSLRNFVVGTAYAKTEAAQLVVISIVVLGIPLPVWQVVGICMAVAGVFILSFSGRRMSIHELLTASIQPAALCGLAAGFAFSITALVLRSASLELGPSTAFAVKATLILLITNLLQTFIQGVYMVFKRPSELQACLALWRRVFPIGALSALGSACWFSGFSLTHVALVRGLGQVEVLFGLGVGHYYLREKIRRSEIVGVIMVILGVIGITFSDFN